MIYKLSIISLSLLSLIFATAVVNAFSHGGSPGFLLDNSLGFLLDDSAVPLLAR